MTVSNTIVGEWFGVSDGEAPSTIYADGCRDVIYRAVPGYAPHWYVSALHEAPVSVASSEGTFFHGFRIQAGIGFDGSKLVQGLMGSEPDLERVQDALEANAFADTLVTDTLKLIRLERISLPDIGVILGVSTRTIQRRVLGQTGQTPRFWSRLARIRESIEQLSFGTNFAALATDCGFYDQAHMTREYRHWLGMTPSLFRTSLHAKRLLGDGGF